MRHFKQLLAIAALAIAPIGCAGGALPTSAPSALGNAGAAAQAAVARAAALREAQPAYRVPVRIDLHGAGLPRQLHGTLSFQPQSGATLAIDDMPAYAKAFSHLAFAGDDPHAWLRDYAVRDGGTVRFAGRPAVVLQMVKRTHSLTVDRTDVYLDAQTGRTLAMVWHYAGGGRIIAAQTYGSNGLPSAVDARVDLAGIHATAAVRFGTYAIGEAVAHRPFVDLKTCKTHSYTAPGTYTVLVSAGTFAGEAYSGDSGISFWAKASFAKGYDDVPALLDVPLTGENIRVYDGAYKLKSGLVGCFYLLAGNYLYKGVSANGAALGYPDVHDYGKPTILGEGPLDISVRRVTTKGGSGTILLKNTNGTVADKGTVTLYPHLP
ncbi:MAG TPA: hypothetical protein VMH02_09470 [Verrucomicrobiae bacterium]|nr:hypothetical protein [Verrucomicrobiae bacterium]